MDVYKYLNEILEVHIEGKKIEKNVFYEWEI